MRREGKGKGKGKADAVPSVSCVYFLSMGLGDVTGIKGVRDFPLGFPLVYEIIQNLTDSRPF